jgi:DNA replication protein DnaC
MKERNTRLLLKEELTDQDFPFQDRFAMLVDMECGRRKNAKLERLIKRAQFRYSQVWPLKKIKNTTDRKLNKTQILWLSTGMYIHEKQNIIIKGASGQGKTYLICAFWGASCRQFYKVNISLFQIY